jgi:topoisomerase-4 subunit B
MPPLYRIDIGQQVFYAQNDAEKEKVLTKHQKKNSKSTQVQRFKGLGEMNPLQLRETTMDPASRSLVQLTLDDERETFEQLDMMLAKKRANDRKNWLSTAD